MMNSKYSAYIFDLYGTLVDIHTDEDSRDFWVQFSKALTAYGIVCDPEVLRAQYRQLCLDETAYVQEALLKAGRSGPGEIDLLRVWHRLGALYHVSLTEENLWRISADFRKLSTTKLRLYDGVKELLTVLRQSGRQVVLLTNAQASFTLPELELLGIDTAFDHILISSEYGVKKPSADFFNQLIRLGIVPGEAVMIGNDDVCDCHGAAAVGMDSLYIHTEQSPPLSGPLPENCREIASLNDLLIMLQLPD